MGIQIHSGDNYRRVVELIRAQAIGSVSEVHVWVGSAWGLQSEEDAKKFENDEFTIQMFYDQLKQAKKLGPLSGVLGMMGAVDVPKEMLHQGEEKMKKYESMINSMTSAERKDAGLLRKNATRIARIAKGSGTKEQEVREFLSQFEKMEKMLNMFKHNRGFRGQIEKMMKGGNIGNLKLT